MVGQRHDLSVVMSRDSAPGAGCRKDFDARQRQPALTPDLGSTLDWGIKPDAHRLTVDPFDDRGLSADVLGPNILGLDDRSNCQFVGCGPLHPMFAGFFNTT